MSKISFVAPKLFAMACDCTPGECGEPFGLVGKQLIFSPRRCAFSTDSIKIW